MSQLANLIQPERIACNVEAVSKKKALEQLSELISEGQDDISAQDVFNSLLARERLGVTGVGHGVAIPHGRLQNSSHTLGALIKLKSAINYEAPDNEPVDLMFALLVPEESTEQHLQILASLAEMFRDPELRQQVRDADSVQSIHHLLIDWSDTH